MDKRFGLVIVAIMFLSAMVPVAVMGEPTRTMDAEILGVMLDGPAAEGGEYAAGTHMISVSLNNTGDEDLIDWLDFEVNVTYASNGTVYLHEINEQNFTFITEGDMVDKEVMEITLEEGEYDIMVKTTIGLTETEATERFLIEDVADFSVENLFFTEGMEYPLGVEISPQCFVELHGNVQEFADTVNLNLIIDHVEGPTSTNVYDETFELLTPASPGVSAGKNWTINMEKWTPDASGDYEATFSVDYDTYNELNNVDTVAFSVALPPVIEGTVTTDGTTPIPGVEVILSTNPETKVMTDDSGYYVFYNISAGNYTLEFYKQWVSGNVSNVEVIPGETQVVDVTLTPLEIGGLRGKVFLPNNFPAVGAVVVIDVPGFQLITVATNSTGVYEWEEVPVGNASLTASLSGYDDAEDWMIIAQGAWNTKDLFLEDIPFEVDFSPPDGEPGFDIDGAIAVFFTRPLNRVSVDQSTLILRNLNTGNPVDVIYAFTDLDKTVVMTPNELLEYSTTYQIEVTTWITDINGDYFPEPVTSTFTTAALVQEIEITTFSPGDDANEVPIDTVITATFPVPMDPETINETTFQLFARGGVIIGATVTYDTLTNIARLEPDSDLDYGERYSVSLDPDIMPESSDYIFNGKTWSFETEVLVTTGTLVGTVVDENGNPFEPSQVTVTLKTGVNTVKTTNPDLTGRFEMTDLDAGTWVLTISVPGYKDYVDENIVINADQTTTLPGTIEMEAEDDDDGEEIPWPFILIIIVVVVFIVLIIYYLLSRSREEPREEAIEEGRRRPMFGGRREEPMGYAGYDEFLEGEFMCPVCGSVVEGEDSICPNCGSEFEEDLFECPECGASIPADVPACPECDAVFEEEEEGEEEEDLYGEEEEVDITEDYEVEDVDEDEFPVERVM
ncbi:MAG: carboxypeptidase regulatory-like domain-containing protein [Thermoplasmatota archaeon]